MRAVVPTLVRPTYTHAPHPIGSEEKMALGSPRKPTFLGLTNKVSSTAPEGTPAFQGYSSTVHFGIHLDWTGQPACQRKAPHPLSPNLRIRRGNYKSGSRQRCLESCLEQSDKTVCLFCFWGHTRQTALRRQALGGTIWDSGTELCQDWSHLRQM